MDDALGRSVQRQPDGDMQAGWRVVPDKITDMDAQVDTQVGTDRPMDSDKDPQTHTHTYLW